MNTVLLFWVNNIQYMPYVVDVQEIKQQQQKQWTIKIIIFQINALNTDSIFNAEPHSILNQRIVKLFTNHAIKIH